MCWLTNKQGLAKTFEMIGPEIETELLTAQDLATFLKVPIATIYGWHHRRIGPPASKVGRHLRYLRETVENWLREQQTS